MKLGYENVLYVPRKRGCKVVESTLPKVRPSDVPMYLRDSEFYKSLNLEDNEEFHVPANLMKENLILENLQDVTHLLHSVRFWGANVPLAPILDFCLKLPSAEIETELCGFEHDLPFVQCLLYVLKNKDSWEKMIVAAMECGNAEMVFHVDKLAGAATFSGNVVAAAAESGNIGFLQLALHKLDNTRVSDVGMLYEGAVEHGHLACIKILNQHPKLSISMFIETHYVATRQLNLASIAAAKGRFECLKYLHCIGCPLYHCTVDAAGSGCVDCLKYVVDNRESPINTQTRAQACLAVVEKDNVAGLQYLHQQGFYLSQNMCIKAASLGSIRCVEYFLSHVRLPARTFTFFITHAAALNGHFDCLKCAHAHGCSLVCTTNNPNIGYRTRFQVPLRAPYVVELVAKRKHWDCVRYLVEHGVRMTKGLSTHLARYNQNTLLQMAIERGCEIDTSVAELFARNGNLPGLKYALEHGCSPSTKILCTAAESGHIECLQFAHEQGSPWSEEVRVAAARGGHMGCLWYAREHGCPYNQNVWGLVENGSGEIEVEEELYW